MPTRSHREIEPEWMQCFPTLNCMEASSSRMDESSISQNRRSRRSNLWMAASLEHAGGMTPVTLRNLSAEGALVEGDHRLVPGAEIVFHKNDLDVAGRIAWVDGRRAGIAFAMSLDPDIVLRHVPPPRPRHEVVHKRPGFRGNLLEQERRFGQALWDRPLPSIDK